MYGIGTRETPFEAAMLQWYLLSARKRAPNANVHFREGISVVFYHVVYWRLMWGHNDGASVPRHVVRGSS